MTNKLEERWDILKPEPFRSIFQLFDASHPLDFYIGKDESGHRLLLLVTPETPPKLNDMRAVRINTLKRADGQWSLLLTLDKSALDPMFSLLCNDLIEASRNTGQSRDQSLGFVLRRLANWRKLLERGVSDLLSEGEVRGLCGELLFLQRLFNKVGFSSAVDAWSGPKLADQDFQTAQVAWEVKTIRPAAESVTISSEYQLQTSIRDLYLVVFELADSLSALPKAFSLNILVERVRDLLSEDHSSSDKFEDLLSSLGYVTRPEYGLLFFEERSVSAYQVSRDFPRITADAIPSALRKIKYDIRLSECAPFCIEMNLVFK